LTPGSNGKKVKRIKENRILSIKKLWENADRIKDRKRSEKKIEVETDVKKIISGIEASIESGKNSSCELKVLVEKVKHDGDIIKIESHQDRKGKKVIER